MFLVTTPGKTLAVVVVGVSNELAAPERLEGGGGAGKSKQLNFICLHKQIVFNSSGSQNGAL